MSERMLSDVEQDALSAAVREQLAYIRNMQDQYADHGRRLIETLAQRGRFAIESGRLDDEVRTLRIDHFDARGVAALSMSPGGVKFSGIVFCARHHPGGRESRTRYGCASCDPVAFTGSRITGRHDMRDVTTAESRQYL